MKIFRRLLGFLSPYKIKPNRIESEKCVMSPTNGYAGIICGMSSR